MFQQQLKLNDMQKCILHERLTAENVHRAKIYAYFVIGLELFMLGRNIYNYGFSLHYYIQLYLVFLVVAIITLLIFSSTSRIADTKRRTSIQHHYLMLYYIFTLLWGVGVTLIDQAFSYGHVTAYLTNFLVATVLFIVPRRSYILLHLLPTTMLVIGMILFQENSAVVTGHVINITVFFIFATLGARFLYTTQERNLLQELLLQETNQEMEMLNKHLGSLAHHDELTRIPNRRGLYSYVNEAIVEGPRTAAIYVLDIDAFKRYNDFYGHLAGDHVLKLVAQAVNDVTVKYNSFTARFGGEEFVVVGFDLQEQQAAELASHIFEAVANLHIPHDASPYFHELSISLGYTSGTVSDQASFEQLITEADLYLYEAKENGRNQVSTVSK